MYEHPQDAARPVQSICTALHAIHRALPLIAGLALSPVAWAGDYTLDQIGFAAEAGLPVATIQRMVESRTDWDLDGEEAALLLARGVSEEVVSLMSGGAHPTDADRARAEELRAGTPAVLETDEEPSEAYEPPGPTEEPFDPYNPLGVVDELPTYATRGSRTTGRVRIPASRAVTRTQLQRTRVVGTIGVVASTGGPILALAGAFSGSDQMYVSGLLATMAGPPMLFGSACRGARVLRRAGVDMPTGACQAAWGVYLSGSVLVVALDMAEPAGVLSGLVALTTYAASVGLGVSQYIRNGDMAGSKRLASTHGTERSVVVRLVPAPVGDRGGAALVGAF